MTTQWQMRELVAADAADCARLEKTLFTEDSPWPADVFAAAISQPYTFYVGAWDGARLAGYAGLAMLGPAANPEAEVHTIGVDPVYQQRGLGRELLRQLLHAADLVGAPVFLEVRTDNEPAIALYASEGFTRVGLRRNYYQPSGAHAYTMTRPARKGEELA